VITNLRIFQATIMPQITNEIVVEYNTNVTTTGSSSGTYIMLNSWEFLPNFLIIFYHKMFLWLKILQLKFQP